MRLDGISPAGIMRAIAGTGEAGPLVTGRTALIGAGVVGLGVAAVVGWKLLHHASVDTPGGSGTSIGVAHGFSQVDHPGGTSSWVATDGRMLLNRQLGAREGYATLVAATAATHPNAPDTDEMAFIRAAGQQQVSVFSVTADGVDAVKRFEATDPSVVAYTTRDSSDLIAGPGATADDVASAHLVTN